ncbi:hypothetical protein CK203_062290 [Vitis vinifera]|uniref:Aspartic peptidase DDI1-type domain-containing protein n=1 Tax=Vitis vinifera TaxID=29760 RepID=A0A438GD09_VITVI|nr:hypothetical protein CK203_062290 [Vitis vinifera]
MRSSMNVGKGIWRPSMLVLVMALIHGSCSRGWDEPNSREKGKFPSQPTQNPKGGMYVLSEDMDMKAKVATIARRLEELELKKMHEVQAISETQAHVMPCTICQSCDHVVDECPTMPAVREMLGKVSLSTKPNPKGVHEVETQEGESSKLREVKAVITLRSGKEVDQPLPKVKQDEELMSKKTLVKESNNQEEKSGKKSASKSSIEEEPRIVIKEDMMKKHMPPLFLKLYMERRKSRIHQKFLKTCADQRGLHVTKNAFLTEQVSAIIQSKSPVKYKDPGCPTISVNIGGTHVEKALLDLGASQSKIPRGVIEDVLVQVDKFYYPVDFVVLDTDPTVKEANYVPIILGRPFLATSNAIINCRNGVMQLTFGNMTLELNIFHLCKRHLHPEEEEGLEEVCLINTLVEEHCDNNLQESLNESLEMFEEGLPEPSDVLPIMSPWRRREEILPLFNQEDSHEATVDEPPKLVLKPLPVDLKYAYLEENEKCPVVVSSTLTSDQEDNLLGVLRKCKKVIGWQISDLKGISPLVCTHHIYMEDDANQ